MTRTTTDQYLDCVSRTTARAATSIILCCLAVFAVTYTVFVLSPWGQFGDELLLVHGERPNSDLLEGGLLYSQLTTPLQLIELSSVAVAVVVVAVLGLLRRLPSLALTTAGMIICAIASSEGLKDLLPRPWHVSNTLSEHRTAANSFPSGHVTIAMSIGVAILLVVAPRFRRLATFLAAGWTGTISVAVVTAGWHRLSDVIGGEVVTLAYFSLAVLLLSTRRPNLVQVSPVPVSARRWVSFGIGLLLVVVACTVADALVTSASHNGTSFSDSPMYLVMHGLPLVQVIVAMISLFSVFIASWLIARVDFAPRLVC